MLKTTTECHALNSGSGRFARLRRHRTTYRPTAIARLKAADGRIDKSLTKSHLALLSVRTQSHLGELRLTKIECVTRGQGEDHQSGEGPLHKVRSDRGPERLGRHPKVGPGENPLPAVTCQIVGPCYHGGGCCAYLPHSRIIRDEPKALARMFPNALKATRKLRPRTAPLSPNTALKNKVATVVPELTKSYLATEVFSLSENSST